MAETLLIRVSARTVSALERGESVRIRLHRKQVVGGVMRRPGERPGRRVRQELWWQIGGLPRPGSLPSRLLLWALAHDRAVTPQQAAKAHRRHRGSTRGVLSHLVAAGLLRREGWGRYVVTAKGKAARKILGKVGRYRAGSNRARVVEWAQKRKRPFGIADVAKLLRVGRGSVHVVLRRLLKDRFIVREGTGVYRARRPARQLDDRREMVAPAGLEPATC